MPTPPTFTLALVQMRCDADREANLHKASAQIRAAAADGRQDRLPAGVVPRPYFCQREDAGLFDLAEPIPGPTTRASGEGRARDEHASSSPRSSSGGRAGVYHNTAVVFDADGSLLGLYRKMHIPDDPLYYEKYYFTPGDLGFRVFDTRFGRSRRARLLGPVVSRRRPGSRPCTAPKCSSIRPRSAGIPARRRNSAWLSTRRGRLMQRSHAIANGVYVAAVNRVGHEGPPDGGLEFWGSVVRQRPVRRAC